MRSNYKMILGYLGTPMFSEGQIYERLQNSKIRIIMKGKLYNRNGRRYLKFDPLYFKILENSVKFIDFTNFFPTSTILGPFVKSYLTSNAEFFHTEIYPELEQSAPYDEVFPI